MNEKLTQLIKRLREEGFFDSVVYSEPNSTLRDAILCVFMLILDEEMAKNMKEDAGFSEMLEMDARTAVEEGKLEEAMMKLIGAA